MTRDWDLEPFGYEARLIDRADGALLATATVRVADGCFFISSLRADDGMITVAVVRRLIRALFARRGSSAVHDVTHLAFERHVDGRLVGRRYRLPSL